MLDLWTRPHLTLCHFQMSFPPTPGGQSPCLGGSRLGTPISVRQTDPTPTLLNFQPLCLEVIASLKHTDNCQENPYLLSVLLGNSGGQTQPLLAEGSALRPVTHTPSSRSLQLLPGSALPGMEKVSGARPSSDPAPFSTLALSTPPRKNRHRSIHSPALPVSSWAPQPHFLQCP